MEFSIAIIGAGISGLSSALALTKNLPSPTPKVTIFEIRSTPSTNGGAVNLTPKALRYLDHLGVYQALLDQDIGAECKTIDIFDLYSGKQYAQVDFRGQTGAGIGKSDDKKYFARRVMRWQLQEALLDVCRTHKNIKIEFAKKVTSIKESADGSVHLSFEDGSNAVSNIVLGCDGVHSATRTLLIEPTRHPKYSGISVVMGMAKLTPNEELRWKATGLVSSRRGSLMCSYFEPTRNEQYMAVVMEITDVASREGWRAKGSAQKSIRDDIYQRFKCDQMPELEKLIESAIEWTLYPVYTLPPGGTWTGLHGKCILLGDAAHAMAPQGESTGICIEDAIVFSRAMIRHQMYGLEAVISAYEAFRRPYIDSAVQQAAQRWETVKDSGWLVYQIKCFLTPWFLWWTAGVRENEFAEDHSELNFKL